MNIQHLHKRRGYWYYIRRVPDHARTVDTRKWINKTTGIRIADDPRGISARARMSDFEIGLETEWADKLAGRDPAPRAAYKRCLAITGAHHLPYLEQSAVERLDNTKFAQRLDIVHADLTHEVAAAMLGTVRPPAPRLSELVDEYVKLNAASLNKKSANQMKKWRVARDTSIATFIKVIGRDLELTEITRAHVIALRNHWNAQATTAAIKIESANKYVGRVASLFKAVCEAHQIGSGDVFAKITIKGGTTGKRSSLDPKWIQSVLLADGALDGLNPEARAILYIVADTGIRPAEACNLLPARICLNHAIPHIQIRPDGCELKTLHSLRDIPLVGAALLAAKEFPNGFPQYRHKNDSLSAAINKYLRQNFPELEANQSLYSLRHSFKNRLRSVHCGDEMKDALMGHENDKPDYGEISLQDKLYWLEKIQFRPPSRF